MVSLIILVGRALQYVFSTEQTAGEVGDEEDKGHISSRSSPTSSLEPKREEPECRFQRLSVNNTDWLFPECYENLRLVGAGAYGQVCSCFDTDRGKTVAIKKLYRPVNDTLHCKRTHRELRLLVNLQHENVIRLLDVFTPDSSLDSFHDVYLVMEFMPTDLKRVLQTQGVTTEAIRIITYQILRGLDFIHSAGVLHRDLKPSNIALDESFAVKILDFGLARIKCTHKCGTMTGYVATRWYRAPEVMLSYEHYGNSGKVDTWSVGCILGEMILGKVLFEGSNELDQIELIINLLGTPPERELKDIDESAQTYLMSNPRPPLKPFADVFADAGDDCVDLLSGLVRFGDEDRLDASQAMQHPFFAELYDASDLSCSRTISPSRLDVQEVDISQWKADLFEEIAQVHEQLMKKHCHSTK